MSAKYYYMLMDEEVGPLTAQELRQHASEGKLSANSFVRKGKEGYWVTADMVKGLLSSSPKSPPPAAPAEVDASAPAGPVARPPRRAGWGTLDPFPDDPDFAEFVDAPVGPIAHNVKVAFILWGLGALLLLGAYLVNSGFAKADARQLEIDNAVTDFRGAISGDYTHRETKKADRTQVYVLVLSGVVSVGLGFVCWAMQGPPG